MFYSTAFKCEWIDIKRNVLRIKRFYWRKIFDKLKVSFWNHIGLPLSLVLLVLNTGNIFIYITKLFFPSLTFVTLMGYTINMTDRYSTHAYTNTKQRKCKLKQNIFFCFSKTTFFRLLVYWSRLSLAVNQHSQWTLASRQLSPWVMKFAATPDGNLMLIEALRN